MHEVLRNTLAALAGALTGMLLIGLSGTIGGYMAPAPAGLDWRNQTAVAAYVASVPVQVLFVVLAGYFFAVLCGAYLSGRLSTDGGARQAVMVTGLFLVASALKARGSAYPAWFVATNMLLIAAAGWLAVVLLARRRKTIS